MVPLKSWDRNFVMAMESIIISNFALELVPMHLENSIITGIKIA